MYKLRIYNYNQSPNSVISTAYHFYCIYLPLMANKNFHILSVRPCHLQPFSIAGYRSIVRQGSKETAIASHPAHATEDSPLSVGRGRHNPGSDESTWGQVESEMIRTVHNGIDDLTTSLLWASSLSLSFSCINDSNSTITRPRYLYYMLTNPVVVSMPCDLLPSRPIYYIFFIRQRLHKYCTSIV